MTPLRSPVLALALAGIFTGLILAGCSLLAPALPPNPWEEYLPSLNPEFELPAELMEWSPQYSITVAIDPATRLFTGTMDLTLPVTGTAPLDRLYFRLYPNLPQFGGSMEIARAAVNDSVVNYGYEADGTAVRLVLPEPLLPGNIATIQLGFTGTAPKRYDDYYTIFGASEDVLSLAGFYPILAGRREGAWALDVTSPQGDVGFHDAAFYRVTLTTPPDQVIAATGSAITETLNADGLRTTRYVIGPAREFSLLMSPRFEVEEADALGTRIRSYFRAGDAATAHAALYDAVAALQIYSDQFGPYPYRDMSIVQAPLTFHGMEFPSMSLIGSQTYSRHLQDLENLVVHEVAHQWWYNQVGNDQVQNPWLDEGLAEFTMYTYYEQRYGHEMAERLRQTRWEVPVTRNRERGKDALIGQPVTSYTDNYETVVYGKGALFFAALRDKIGPEKFNALMRAYLERYRWKIATPAAFQEVAEDVSGQDLDALFQEWVNGGTVAKQ